MRKIWRVAATEYLNSVRSKAFILGVIATDRSEFCVARARFAVLPPIRARPAPGRTVDVFRDGIGGARDCCSRPRMHAICATITADHPEMSPSVRTARWQRHLAE